MSLIMQDRSIAAPHLQRKNMYRALVVPALLLSLTACGARDFAGPDPDPAIAVLAADVKYQVEGTYASCRITYTDPREGTLAHNVTSLPWTTAFRVVVDEETGPFDAIVSAKCTDPDKLGKSTSFVFVDGAMKATSSAVGPGATAEASYRVGGTP